MNFPGKLEKLIRRSGKTQKEIADDLGIRPSRISGWKAGVTPEVATLRKLAEYFGVPASVLSDDEADLDDVVEGSPTSYGSSSRIAELERRIEEHRTIAKVFVERGWKLSSADLLTSKDLIAGYEAESKAIPSNTGCRKHHHVPGVKDERRSA